MSNEFNPGVAFDLGTAARTRASEAGNPICQHEKERIEAVNEPELIECKASLKVLSDEREEILRFLAGLLRDQLGPRNGRFYLASAIILGLAGFSFAHFALAPFGFGMHVWAFSAGLAIVCPVLTEMFLEKCGGVRTIKVTVATAFVASLTGLTILAVIRGDIVLLYIKQALSGAVQDYNTTNAIAMTDAVQFYQASAWKLQLFFGLLALSMELATGLAVWETRKVVPTTEDAGERARQRLAAIDKAIPPLVGRIVLLQNQPRVFEAQFKRDFHRGLLQSPGNDTPSRIGPILLALLGGFALALAARAQTPTVVVGIDLSQSDTVATHDGGSTHQENLKAAAKTIAGLPPGARFSVIGITGESFSRPVILLSNQIPIDGGPLTFLNRVSLARDKYAAEVLRIGGARKPDAATTDVLGFLMLVEDICGHAPGRCVVVIFGDMRQSAWPINIEKQKVVPIAAALKTAEWAHLMASLKDVDVFVYGVHAAGKDVAYWQSLRDFWKAYFAKAGANLQTFSMFREGPNFTSGGKN